MSQFPKMLYRAEGAKLVNRSVGDADALAAAEAEGWGEYAAAKAAAAKARTPAGVGASNIPSPPAAPAATSAADAAKIKQLEATVLAERDAAASARELAEAAGDRIVVLEGFLSELRDDEGAPEELRAAIAKLLDGEGLGGAEPGEAKAAKKTRAKKPAAS